MIRSQHVHCRFRGAPDSDGDLFWECTFLLEEIRESPEFHDLVREDKAHWVLALAWLASFVFWG